MSSTSIRIVAAFAMSLGLMLTGCSNSRGSGSTCSGFELACMNSAGVTACTPVSIDPNNCGACGNVCALGQTCTMGSCSGTPIDGAVRDSGSQDSGPSACSPSCSSSQRCCGTDCVGRSVTAGSNGREDPSFMNCNGCGLSCDSTRASACSASGSGAPHCMCGTSDACTGARQCMATGATFACVDTGTDPNNCGAPGHACGLEEVCVAGMCTCGSGSSATVCATGTTCCGGSCINTTADEANCGACGTTCGEGTTCTDSMCRCGTEVCAAAAGTDLGEICCDAHCVASDDSNCGACGNMCDTSSMLSCVYGMDITGGTSRVCCGIDLGGLGGGGIPGGGGAICGDFGGGIPGFP